MRSGTDNRSADCEAIVGSAKLLWAKAVLVMLGMGSELCMSVQILLQEGWRLQRKLY